MSQSKIEVRGIGWSMRPVDSIKPYAKNAKIHGAQQIDKLRKSLREFGFVRPLLIDGDGNLISGHGTMEAARQEGMEQVPCVVVDGLTEAQRRAYIHADNKLSELSSWDESLIGLELQDLTDLGMDMGALGFDLSDLDMKTDGAEKEVNSEALDLDEEDEETDRSASRRAFHCPKCGFVFEVET